MPGSLVVHVVAVSPIVTTRLRIDGLSHGIPRIVMHQPSLAAVTSLAYRLRPTFPSILLSSPSHGSLALPSGGHRALFFFCLWQCAFATSSLPLSFRGAPSQASFVQCPTNTLDRDH